MSESTAAQPSADQALIHAAILLFGRDGYAAVSTRALSEAAGTNISAIKYYFGGKEELYRAAVAHVGEVLTPRMEFAMAAFEQGRSLVGDDRERQAQLISQLVSRIIHVFLTDEHIPSFLPFVLREFFTPSPHFDIFYEAFPRHLHELWTEIVALAYDLDPEDEVTIVRAHGIIGQMMIFHVGRQVLFRRLNWDDFTPERIELITSEVQQLVLRALSFPPESQT